MKKWAIGSILIISIFFIFHLSRGQEKPPNSGEVYDSAMELFYKGKYQEAIEGFSKLIETFPASKLASYSHYMIGQSLLKMEKYEEAIQKFEYYLKTYSEGNRVEQTEKELQMAKEKLKEKKEKEAPVVETKPSPKEPKKEEVKAVPEEPKLKILPEAKKVKRRICAQVSYLDGRNLKEVEKRIKELKNAGVDTLILRVFQNKGDRMYKFVTPRHEEGVYFKTEHALVIDDILGKIAEIVHQNGLELFAWMTTRYATYGIEGRPEYRCKSYNFETKKMEIARGLNLFHPDVLKRLEGLFRDLARYPIDGILFQDDLILRHNEDFSMEANKAFLKEYGYSPHPDLFYIDPYKTESGRYYVKAYTDRFWTWANWKNRWLMNVAKRLMASARESNSNLQFAINLYFESVLNHPNGVAWFSQTLSEALEQDFDYYAIMAYHRQAMKNRNIEVKEAIDLMAEVAQKAVKSVGDPSKVLMKVWILDWKTNEAVGYELAPQKEVEEILDGILGHGEVSLAFVPYIHQFPLHLLKGKWTSTSK
jgi:biofilm PGA synthesis lipoprotein PgaB